MIMMMLICLFPFLLFDSIHSVVCLLARVFCLFVCLFVLCVFCLLVCFTSNSKSGGKFSPHIKFTSFDLKGRVSIATALCKLHDLVHFILLALGADSKSAQ